MDYLDNIGNTSMSNLLSMKAPVKAIINSFNNGHQPINEKSESLHDLKKDTSFNTSASGWLFSKNNGNNNSRQDIKTVNPQKQIKLMDEVLFNPDIVAIGLEFCKFFIF